MLKPQSCMFFGTDPLELLDAEALHACGVDGGSELFVMHKLETASSSSTMQGVSRRTEIMMRRNKVRFQIIRNLETMHH